MGLDANISKIKSKISSYEEYEDIRRVKAKELTEENFYKWESSAFYTSEWFIHSFINKIPKSIKTDYDAGESMLITKQDLEFLIKELQRKLKTYKGLKQIIKLYNYSNQKEIIKHYNRKWWRKNVLKPLEILLKRTDFENETLFYGAWF